MQVQKLQDCSYLKMCKDIIIICDSVQVKLKFYLPSFFTPLCVEDPLMSISVTVSEVIKYIF